MPTTHCLPSGSPRASNTLNVQGVVYGSNIPAGITQVGIAVYIAGLYLGNPINYPPPLGDSTTPPFEFRVLSMANALAAIGWQVLAPAPPGYGYMGGVGGNGQLCFSDINGDAGNGSRMKATYLEWWDHVHADIRKNISATQPIAVIGGSGGGYVALQIALNRASDIVGYVAHHPVSMWSDLSPTFSSPLNFTTLTSTGADVTSSGLNGVTSIPGLLGWGSVDAVVGASPWTADTLTPAIYSAAHGAGAPVSPNCDGTGTANAGSPAENHALTSSADNANPNNDVFQIANWFSTVL